MWISSVHLFPRIVCMKALFAALLMSSSLLELTISFKIVHESSSSATRKVLEIEGGRIPSDVPTPVHLTVPETEIL